MNFSKKVDNIIYEIKDINKMYFSLQHKNKKLSIKLKEKKYDGGNGGNGGDGGDGGDGGNGGNGGDGNNMSRPIGYGTTVDNFIDTNDFPAAGASSGSNINSSHNRWTTSLRRRW